MAGAKFEYDSTGGTFFYFLLSFEALVVIPCTYYFYPRSIDQNEDKKNRDKSLCHCDNCRIKNSRLRSQEPWRKAKERFIKFLLLLGWSALFLTLYKVANLQHDYIAYDPFEILQIDAGASMSEIKKAYRKLSLIYHPDKETGDEKQFMMIAKAYAALTDEESRKNWEVYGDPDGPGAMSFGIALPSWIIEKQNSVYVLGLYALVFMVALPVAVGVWWYRSVRCGDLVLLDTTQLYLFYIYKTPHMILKRILMVIAASMEFRRTYNSEIIERPSDNVEVNLLIKELPNLGEKNREKPLCFSYSIKARALAYAHLSRMKLPATLEEDRLYVVKKFPLLIEEFVQCASQLTMLALAGRIARMPSLDTMENAMRLSPCIVQALCDSKSSLLQLPHITEDLLRHFSTRKRNIRTLKNLACMKDDDRRSLLRSLNDDEYQDLITVLAKMPIVDVEVKSEVLDDEDSCTITPGAIVTVTTTLHRRDMQSLFDDECNNVQDEGADDGEEEAGNAAGDHNSQAKPQKSNFKRQNKKKKGKGGSKLKKRTARVVTKKPEENKNGVLPQAKPVEKEKVVKQKEKDSDNSGADSEVEEESSCNSAGSGDEAQETNDQTAKPEKEADDDDQWDKFQAKISKREMVLETKSKKSHSVHCPFFPDEKEEYWWVYLVDKKRHALITAPYLVTNLVTTEEVELKFTAPPKPGLYTYCVMVRSDSYIDFDVNKPIKLDVKEAKEVDLTKIQWDVSEEEEEKDEEESAVEDSDLATDDELDDD